MQDTVTIVGRVATDPTQGQTRGGITVTNFRLASTHRRFDDATQTWTDSDTNWYSVAAFRQLGEHAKASLRTGDSVIVSGRLKIRSWEANGKQGTSVDIDADAIGHDLRWGTTAFLARSRASGSSETAERGAGLGARVGGEAEGVETEPRDHTEHDADGHEVDRSTGNEALRDLDLSWAAQPMAGHDARSPAL